MSLYRGIIKLEPSIITDDYMNMVAQVENEESTRIMASASMGQVVFSPIYYFAVVTKIKNSIIPSVLSNRSRVGVFA